MQKLDKRVQRMEMNKVKRDKITNAESDLDHLPLGKLDLGISEMDWTSL